MIQFNFPRFDPSRDTSHQKSLESNIWLFWLLAEFNLIFSSRIYRSSYASVLFFFFSIRSFIRFSIESRTKLKEKKEKTKKKKKEKKWGGSTVTRSRNLWWEAKWYGKRGEGERKKKEKRKKKKEIIIRDVVESFVDNHGPTIIVIVNKVQHAALLNSTSTKRIIQNT